MTEHVGPDDAADRLFETLDELAGIDASGDPEQELRDAEPVALSPGFAERTREGIRAQQARRVDGGGLHRRRTWWIAASISLCLIACVPLVLWSTRRSTEELGFEHALEVVQDTRYSDNSRHAAFIAAAAWIRVGITTIKERLVKTPQVEPNVELLFAQIRSLCNTPNRIQVSPAERGRFDATLRTIEHGDTEAATAAMPDYLSSVAYGISVMHSARNQGPRFDRDFASQIAHIQSRLN